jgi:hypothetical protein
MAVVQVYAIHWRIVFDHTQHQIDKEERREAAVAVALLSVNTDFLSVTTDEMSSQMEKVDFGQFLSKFFGRWHDSSTRWLESKVRL